MKLHQTKNADYPNFSHKLKPIIDVAKYQELMLQEQQIRFTEFCEETKLATFSENIR